MIACQPIAQITEVKISISSWESVINTRPKGRGSGAGARFWETRVSIPNNHKNQAK